MRSSIYMKYWCDDPIKEMISEKNSFVPDDGTKFSELDWNENDHIEFIDDIEKKAEIKFTDEELGEIFSEEATISDFHSILKTACINKEAKITSMSQRSSMKTYRNKNKAQLAMKAKMRRKRIQQGSHIQKNRMGSAAGGYSFVASGGNVAESKKSISMKPMAPKRIGGRKLKMFKT
jgi:acyl carrier protein